MEKIDLFPIFLKKKRVGGAWGQLYTGRVGEAVSAAISATVDFAALQARVQRLEDARLGDAVSVALYATNEVAAFQNRVQRVEENFEAWTRMGLSLHELSTTVSSIPVQMAEVKEVIDKSESMLTNESDRCVKVDQSLAALSSQMEAHKVHCESMFAMKRKKRKPWKVQVAVTQERKRMRVSQNALRGLEAWRREEEKRRDAWRLEQETRQRDELRAMQNWIAQEEARQKKKVDEEEMRQRQRREELERKEAMLRDLQQEVTQRFAQLGKQTQKDENKDETRQETNRECERLEKIRMDISETLGSVEQRTASIKTEAASMMQQCDRVREMYSGIGTINGTLTHHEQRITVLNEKLLLPGQILNCFDLLNGVCNKVSAFQNELTLLKVKIDNVERLDGQRGTQITSVENQLVLMQDATNQLRSDLNSVCNDGNRTFNFHSSNWGPPLGDDDDRCARSLGSPLPFCADNHIGENSLPFPSSRKTLNLAAAGRNIWVSATK